MNMTKKRNNSPNLTQYLGPLIILSVLIFLFVQGCSQNKSVDTKRIVIGAQNDVQTINPNVCF